MQVNPNNNVPGPIGVPRVKSNALTATPQDKTVPAGSADLARALRNVPAVRAVKVAQAKALVQDPSYPNEAALRRVADVLADHLRPRNASE
jgi:hypothetical protein